MPVKKDPKSMVPKNVRVHEITATDITVSCDPSADTVITGYEFRISETSTLTFATSRMSNRPQVTFSGLKPNTEYYLSVKVELPTGMSLASEVVKATTLPAKEPEKKETKSGLPNLLKIIGGVIVLIILVILLVQLFNSYKVKQSRVQNQISEVTPSDEDVLVPQKRYQEPGKGSAVTFNAPSSNHTFNINQGVDGVTKLANESLGSGVINKIKVDDTSLPSYAFEETIEQGGTLTIRMFPEVRHRDVWVEPLDGGAIRAMDVAGNHIENEVPGQVLHGRGMVVSSTDPTRAVRVMVTICDHVVRQTAQ